MKRILLLLSLLSIMACSHAVPEIPLNISEIKTYRVSDNLVRVIRYNMELEAKLIFQLIGTPGRTLLDTSVITGIPFNGAVIEFNDSQGSYIESFSVTDNVALFQVEIFPNDGGSDLYNCKINIEKDTLGQTLCKKE